MRLLQVSANPIVADDDGIAAAQTPGSATDLTLNGVGVLTYPYFPLANGSYGSSTRPEARLNPPRPVLFTTVSNESAKTLTVYGTDRAGTPITETVTGPNATTGSTTKLFASVYRIATSAAFTGNVIAGWSVTSYSKWLFAGQLDLSDPNWKLRAFFLSTGTATYDIEATSMSMNLRAIHGEGRADAAPTYLGGDLPDDIVTLAAAQAGNYTSDNDTPWVAVRLRVTAQTTAVHLRIIPGQ